jgi:hypothetical protein
VLALLPLLLSLVQDAPELRLEVQPARPFEGQQVLLEWTLSIPRSHAERGLGQLFQRPLSVPVELQVAGGCVERLDWIPAESSADPVVLNGELVPVEVSGFGSGSEGPARVRLLAALSCDRSGPIELPMTTARYGLEGASGLGLGLGPGLEEVRVRAEAASLVVRALPEEGRPIGFTGSVGRPVADWDATPPAGLSGTWVLRATDARGGEPPRWEPGPGWSASGPAGLGGGVFQYSLAATAAPSASIQPLRWPWFDPESESYREEALALPNGADTPQAPESGPPQEPALARGLPALLLAWALAVVSYWLWGARAALPDQP